MSSSSGFGENGGFNLPTSGTAPARASRTPNALRLRELRLDRQRRHPADARDPDLLSCHHPPPVRRHHARPRLRMGTMAVTAPGLRRRTRIPGRKQHDDHPGRWPHDLTDVQRSRHDGRSSPRTHSCGPSGPLRRRRDTSPWTTWASRSWAPARPSKCAQGAIDAAGKKAKAEASCYSKALQKGVPVDGNCIQKAVNAFDSGFAKAGDKGDCLVGGRHGDNLDPATFEAAVDNMIASTLQIVSNGVAGAGHLRRQEDGRRSARRPRPSRSAGPKAAKLRAPRRPDRAAPKAAVVLQQLAQEPAGPRTSSARSRRRSTSSPRRCRAA